VATELLLNGFPPLRLVRRFLRTPEQGAATAIYLAADPAVAEVTGEYFIDSRPVPLTPKALDDDAALRLWEPQRGAGGVGLRGEEFAVRDSPSATGRSPRRRTVRSCSPAASAASSRK